MGRRSRYRMSKLRSVRGPDASSAEGLVLALGWLLQRRELLDLQAFDRAEVLHVAGE